MHCNLESEMFFKELTIFHGFSEGRRRVKIEPSWVCVLEVHSGLVQLDIAVVLDEGVVLYLILLGGMDPGF